MAGRARVATGGLAGALAVAIAACAPAERVGEYAPPPEPAAEAPDYAEAAPPYGRDGRRESSEHPDGRLRDLASSVAVILPGDRVEVIGQSVILGGSTLDEQIQVQYRAPLCPRERFSQQPTPGVCTGFLIGDDLLVTAGHCITSTEQCRGQRFVFDFRQEEAGVAPLHASQLFGCRDVVAREEEGNRDYAIVRLDRTTGRPPLQFATEDLVGTGQSVAAIGHPSGLPQKIAAGAHIQRMGRDHFVTNLDTFQGSSGSPVIDTDGYVVEGVLTAGGDDYALDSTDGCVRVNACPASGAGCPGERATKMATVAAALPESRR